MYFPPFPPLFIWTKHENFKANAADLDIDQFCKNGTDGHQMDQVIGKPEGSAKNQNFVFYSANIHCKLMNCKLINFQLGAYFRVFGTGTYK